MTSTIQPKGTYHGVPVYDFDDSNRGEVLSHQRRWDELAARHGGFRSDYAQGFWVITDPEAIQSAYQDPATFSSGSVVPYDPEPQYMWIPEMLDPPVHTQWRRLLGREFSPTTIARREDQMRVLTNELLDEIAPMGEADVLDTFARRFPTTIFMRIMGLPTEDLELFLHWVDEILHLPAEEDPDRARMLKAFASVSEYFDEQIAERRDDPRDDLLSRAMTWSVDGEPISDSDMHAFCVLMFQAGLDTVPIQLGYSFYHLATHPEDRRQIVEHPELISTAVEEILRVYSFVQPSRRATRDVELAGCPIKAGDMALLPLAVVNRDEERYPNPLEIDLNRSTSNHIAFGSGPHRCLGSHLARLELNIALEEWHKRIPDYELSDQAPVMQFGSMYGIQALRLRWTT